MEACIENSTKSLLFLDHVRFDPQPPMTVSVLEVESNDKDDSEGPLRWTCSPSTSKVLLVDVLLFQYGYGILIDTECVRRDCHVVKYSQILMNDLFIMYYFTYPQIAFLDDSQHVTCNLRGKLQLSEFCV